jgi:hypothetical protein
MTFIVLRRCYGNFFTCDDQKSGRTDSLTLEEVVLPLKTDYMGFVAWGEYPHKFATVLNDLYYTQALLWQLLHM